MTRVIPPTEAGINAWLDEALNLEKTLEYREFRLDRVHAVLPFLPRPPAPITVTGTKGKGSTTRLMECGLLACGRRTLAFTSPHLATVRERWRLDGIPIEAGPLAARCSEVAAIEAASGIGLTYFERCFAIAVLFAAARPDAVFLLEVGLGGRLDCANALDAALVVMTHLSRDHCQMLGDTLDLIAGEKLALCRAGRPVVIAPQSPAGAEAIRGRLPAGSPAQWVARAPRFRLALAGEHQQDNASTALAALRVALPGLDEAALRAGFATASLAGRCQLVEVAERRLLVDGAHNGVSIAATLATAATTLRPGWRLVLGVAKDKEIAEIIAAIPAGVTATRTGYASSRARLAGDWPEAVQAWPFAGDIASALAAVPAGVDVCVTGSLYLAAETLAHLGLAGQLPG